MQADLAHKAGVITVQQEHICALDDALQVKTPSKSSAMPLSSAVIMSQQAQSLHSLAACLLLSLLSQ